MNAIASLGRNVQDDFSEALMQDQTRKMTEPNLEIRPMTSGELSLAIDWAAREGWNPGLDDAACFAEADRGGFMMAFLDRAPIGCISAVRYDAGFGFIGFYLVRPDLRGKGFGLQLWRTAMSRLEPCTIGLDGVIAQEENYRKSGFVLAHRNKRFGGIASSVATYDSGVTAITPRLVDAVIDYDRAFFPAPRLNFLRCWLTTKQHRGMVILENGAVRGYGVVRPCRQGFKIGPLFANSVDRADLLFCALAQQADHAPIFLDCPEPNVSATELALKHGLSPVFETAHMYRGQEPALPLARIFGITTFELG